MRPSARDRDELRDISIERKYTKHAEGSVLISYGDTKVLCNASVVPGVPRFLKGQGQGWVTAEYGMLPRATHDRTMRESNRGPSGRTLEIQRLIARSLRQAVNLSQLGENTITVDCDVLQADGGTRTASITGGCVALYDAISHMLTRKMIKKNPFKRFIAAVSVGMYENLPILDLDYKEDSSAQTDMNVVMADNLEFIEIQGTAEDKPFKHTDLNGMLDIATKGIRNLLHAQKQAVEA